MFVEADQDADALLDKRELALWLHKNEMINKAAEIKGEFTVFRNLSCLQSFVVLY